MRFSFMLHPPSTQMKATIRGVTYDTSKASYVRGTFTGHGGWHGCSEVLARTRSGRYFIHRTYRQPPNHPAGIPASDRAKSKAAGNGLGPVEYHEIIPLTRLEALLRCLAAMVPTDLHPELRRLLRRRANLPPARSAKPPPQARPAAG